MKISIGADHRGFQLKETIVKHFPQLEWIDQGTHTPERTDYPVYAQRVSKDVLEHRADVGILLCGSGVGVAMAANRFKGIYAAVCWNDTLARIAKEDDGSNVLVLPADFVAKEDAFLIVSAWLSATFKGGRYQERLAMIDADCK